MGNTLLEGELNDAQLENIIGGNQASNTREEQIKKWEKTNKELEKRN